MCDSPAEQIAKIDRELAAFLRPRLNHPAGRNDWMWAQVDRYLDRRLEVMASAR
jgi:hypothetical protein